MAVINENKTAELLTTEKSRCLGYCVARHQELLQWVAVQTATLTHRAGFTILESPGGSEDPNH
jgi:hypothetical protein